MNVFITNRKGQLIWSRNEVGGFTSSAYRGDSTLKKIEAALESALSQCKGELDLADDSNGVLDHGAAVP
ncbi:MULTISPECIES: hypothetical protein [unclassified Pseudomonas]|uniref:hypothetical protein n=1 Tax=unclassified Pseudomonas TaxID=196821 RepID=UPI00159419D3|nr:MULTISPECIES: hypothetical protein [unclassified Pseudomonas]